MKHRYRFRIFDFLEESFYDGEFREFSEAQRAAQSKFRRKTAIVRTIDDEYETIFAIFTPGRGWRGGIWDFYKFWQQL